MGAATIRTIIPVRMILGEVLFKVQGSRFKVQGCKRTQTVSYLSRLDVFRYRIKPFIRLLAVMHRVDRSSKSFSFK